MEQGLCHFPTKLTLLKRYVTRTDKSNQRDEEISETCFEELKNTNAFLFHWESHGLSYGIKKADLINTTLKKVCLINGSREYLPKALSIYPALKVIEVYAKKEVLKERLIKRGRETPEEIEERLSRINLKYEIPKDTKLWVIDNSSSLHAATEEFKRILTSIMEDTNILEERNNQRGEEYFRG
jgi:ribose 1,5-bisphosphokinase